MKLRVLVLFSSPPGQPPLRLDKEDRLIHALARRFKTKVVIDRHHATRVDDIHELIVDREYDIIQFSGHGDANGIYLERRHCDTGEVVSPSRLVNLLRLSAKAPSLVLLLCCYGRNHVTTLADAAPFVITLDGAVEDEHCLNFIESFYEQRFRGKSTTDSYHRALALLQARDQKFDACALLRRQMIKQNASFFVECRPLPDQDPVLINLDAVKSEFKRLGMEEEEFCHLLARRLRIHRWIFNTPREHALIPVGRMLFGDFSWENAKDQVYCNRLIRLRADIPEKHWQEWSRLLNAYNDLASCEYRQDQSPADPSRRSMLREAVELYQDTLRRFIEPAQAAFGELRAVRLVANVVQVRTHIEAAAAHLEAGRLPAVVMQLELALTNLHEIVTVLQPPEET